MLEKDLQQFQKQLTYTPEVEGEPLSGKRKEVVVCGMGGSHLAGDILQAWSQDAESPVSDLHITVWSDYELPPLHNTSKDDAVVVVVSHSGNTEEAISSFRSAVQLELPVAVITAGGKLLSLAKEEQVPYVALPSGGIQPRVSVGVILRALLALLGREEALSRVAEISELNNEEIKEKGKELAESLGECIPIAYAETRNQHMAYYWKIALNETGKIPAFYNVLPEANHNELEGFAHSESEGQFCILFLEDGLEHSRVKKRVEVLSGLYGERNIPLERVAVEGASIPERAFYSLLFASWTAYFLAEQRGIDPEAVPTIEKLKRLL